MALARRCVVLVAACATVSGTVAAATDGAGTLSVTVGTLGQGGGVSIPAAA